MIKNAETIEGYVYPWALARSIYVGSGSNLLVRTAAARAIGGYDESFRFNQDLEFLTRLTKEGKLAYLDEDLLTIHYEIREVTPPPGYIQTEDRLKSSHPYRPHDK